MRILKTWEMIKELTENPKKKFKSIHENKSIAPTFVVMGDSGILFENSLGKSTALYYIGSDWRWEEVKEPMTFIEVADLVLNSLIEDVQQAQNNFNNANEDYINIAAYELMKAEDKLNNYIREKKHKERIKKTFQPPTEKVK